MASRVAARIAREDVAINVGHSTIPSVVNSVWTIGIRDTIGLVHANNGEVVAVALQALEVADIGTLRHVHANRRQSDRNKSQQQGNHNKHFFIIQMPDGGLNYYEILQKESGMTE